MPKCQYKIINTKNIKLLKTIKLLLSYAKNKGKKSSNISSYLLSGLQYCLWLKTLCSCYPPIKETAHSSELPHISFWLVVPDALGMRSVLAGKFTHRGWQNYKYGPSFAVVLVRLTMMEKMLMRQINLNRLTGKFKVNLKANLKVYLWLPGHELYQTVRNIPSRSKTTT